MENSARNMRYLAIDLGSTYLKGAVLDLDRLRFEHSQRTRTPGSLHPEGSLLFEICPTSLSNAVCGLLDRLLQVAPDAEGLMMCNQMHGIVLVNHRGEPRSNAITWQDQRGALRVPGEGGCSYVEWIEKRLPVELRAALGNELRAGLPIVNLTWLAREGGLSSEELTAVSLPDYVLSRLAGTVAVVDVTNAASYGLLDVQRGVWSAEALEMLGLEQFRMPRISENKIAYTVAVGGRKLACHIPVGDHQCALLGSLLSEGELSVNVATGSQVSTLSTAPCAGQGQVRPFLDGRFLHTVTHIPAGRSLNVLIRLVTELATRAGTPVRDPWCLVEQAVTEIESTDLNFDLSFFENQSSGRGALRNIGENNLTVGHLFRAAFARMADDYCRYSQWLPSRQDGWLGLVFSGGIAHKVPVLRELISERFGVSSRLSPTHEDAINGLLALAITVTGRAKSLGQSIELLASGGRQ